MKIWLGKGVALRRSDARLPSELTEGERLYYHERNFHECPIEVVIYGVVRARIRWQPNAPFMTVDEVDEVE